MTDLSDEEIADLRKLFGDGCDGVTIGQCVNVLHILDEVDRLRKLRATVRRWAEVELADDAQNEQARELLDATEPPK